MSNIRPSVILGACALLWAGLVLDGPAVRRAALLAASRLCGRAAEQLHRASIAAGLAYVDLAYPPEDAPDSAHAR